jgi:DNA-binding IclR family transcriptional regulator
LIHFIAENEGAPVSRAAKQLGLSQSELLRLLVVLGDDRSMGGLGLVAARDEGPRRLLSLTVAGRDWLARNQ